MTKAATAPFTSEQKIGATAILGEYAVSAFLALKVFHDAPGLAVLAELALLMVSDQILAPNRIASKTTALFEQLPGASVHDWSDAIDWGNPSTIALIAVQS